jgi:hypothetical protein
MILSLILCALVAGQAYAATTAATITIAPGSTPGTWTVTINGGTPTSCSSTSSIVQAIQSQASSATSYQVTLQDSSGGTLKSWSTSASSMLQSDVDSNVGSGSGSGSSGSGSDSSGSSDSSSSDSSSGGSGEGKDGKGNNGKHLGQMKVKCFASDSTVQTRHGKMSMEQLFQSPNTEVLTVNGEYTPVKMFFHANQNQLVEFNQITTKEGVLKATDGHLVYKAGNEVVSAGKIQVGDYLLNGQMESVEVLSVQKVQSRGFYAPLTATANLLVDGHFVSSYSEVETPMIQNLMFSYIQAMSAILPTRIVQSVTGFDNAEAAIGFLQLSQKFLA